MSSAVVEQFRLKVQESKVNLQQHFRIKVADMFGEGVITMQERDDMLTIIGDAFH